MGLLNNKRIAVLANDGYEESELLQPVERLKNEGAEVVIVSTKAGKIKGMTKHQWGGEVDVDKTTVEANAADFNGLVLPGGTINPDSLRVDENAVKFAKDFFEQGKPVAAICHGPQTLINAGVLNGRKMTSVKNISQDLMNAGAQWVDEEVVTDQGFVTSRTPVDLPAFCDKMVEEFGEGVHDGQHA